jgi:hypothetical protein
MFRAFSLNHFTMDSQRELFFKIWMERPHYSEVSGAYLGEDARAHYFAHILGKGAYPAFKLREDNIVLLTMEEHRQFDQGDVDKLKKDPRWSKVFEKKELLKQEYYKK